MNMYLEPCMSDIGEVEKSHFRIYRRNKTEKQIEFKLYTPKSEIMWHEKLYNNAKNVVAFPTMKTEHIPIGTSNIYKFKKTNEIEISNKIEYLYVKPILRVYKFSHRFVLIQSEY